MSDSSDSKQTASANGRARWLDALIALVLIVLAVPAHADGLDHRRPMRATALLLHNVAVRRIPVPASVGQAKR